MNKKVYPILLAFLCMGFGDLGGPLKSLFETSFGLSSTVATLVTTTLTFGMFGLLAIPMGIVQYKKGKAFVLSLGLFTAVAGMVVGMIGVEVNVYTASIALLLMGAGAAMLQVSGNPIMRDVSAEGKFSKNLSIAQGIKSIGTLSTALIPLLAALLITREAGWLNRGYSWRIMFPIFGAVLLVTGIWLLALNIKEKADAKVKPTTFGTSFKALADPYIAIMTLSIFIYVGIEVCLFANAATYLGNIHGLNDLSLVAAEKQSKILDFFIKIGLNDISLLATVAAMSSLIVGRIVGGFILGKVDPKKFFIVTTVVALIGFCGFLITSSQVFTWIALVVAGLGLANIFPLIFSITIDDRPNYQNEISGLMVTAIIGGAIVPLAMAAITDAVNKGVAEGATKIGVVYGFLWPIALLVFLAGVAFVVLAKGKKKEA
ncbi:MAG: MFS transporter [Spirochaetales bacterium]|nr:MFS transporter [Spirochaetales bacterium]